MSKPIDQERADFEAECERAGFPRPSNFCSESRTYVSERIQGRFEWFQVMREAAQPAGVAVPKGWKLVPIKPTAEMKAVCRVAGKTQVWADMIAASPAAPHPVSGEQKPDALRKRFSDIEDEIMAGKHNAASVFTAMRTAALYVGQPASHDVAVLVEAAAEMFDMLEWRAGDTGDLLLSNDQRDQWSALIAAHRAQQGEQS